MFIVQVHITVEEDAVQAFRNATVENARMSVKEPGVVRFDVIQQTDDPTRFVLVEIYKSEEAVVEHKNTEHYAEWKSIVDDMMAEPRYSIKYRNVFPGDDGKW
ncbi:MAG: antibiotic biosynthesis monooxygenase [Chloroflexota bacterium]